MLSGGIEREHWVFLINTFMPGGPKKNVPKIRSRITKIKRKF